MIGKTPDKPPEPHEFKPHDITWEKPRCSICWKIENHPIHDPKEK